jgi:L,D-peptidoglycan transpeptidase YkuD (ErfK/YbiS/YcfS/YnhG family)
MTANAPLRTINIVAAGGRSRGMLVADGVFASCAIGRSGKSTRKREGDGATPVGAFGLRALLYRPDRVARPHTSLPVTPIAPTSGWCDDPAHPAYNHPVTLPFAASHERLWRDDGLYDLVVVLDYNLTRPVPGLGSAIFLHLARADFAPTAGCVAIAVAAMRHLLPRVGDRTVLRIS